MVSDKAAILKLNCKYGKELLLRASHSIRVSVYTCTYYVPYIYIYIYIYMNNYGKR